MSKAYYKQLLAEGIRKANDSVRKLTDEEEI